MSYCACVCVRLLVSKDVFLFSSILVGSRVALIFTMGAIKLESAKCWKNSSFFSVSGKLPTGSLSNIPWRRTGVKYANNEVGRTLVLMSDVFFAFCCCCLKDLMLVVV